eukprot:3259350-Amphidinium_carterae.1
MLFLTSPENFGQWHGLLSEAHVPPSDDGRSWWICSYHRTFSYQLFQRWLHASSTVHSLMPSIHASLKT